MTTRLANARTYPDKLKHIKNNMSLLSKAQPQAMEAFGALHRAGSNSGTLDVNIKELIALAISAAMRCDDFIAFHTNGALKAGATFEEITDALRVAILMGGGPSVMYATHVIEAVEQFESATR